MRTVEENLILLPNMKQLFLFARLTSNHIFAYLSSGIICFNLQKSLIFDFLLGSSQKTFYWLAYFLNQLNVEPLQQNQHS